MARHIVGLVVLLAAVTGTASAQIITIKTVPIAQADQFGIFPSRNLGMGGVSIAVADPMLDPFQNPAKGGKLATPYLYGSPGLYHVSSDAGSGRTLPMAAAMRAGSWFGGVALALQEIDASRQFSNPPPCINCFELQASADVAPPGSLSAKSHGNEMVYAMAGKTLPGANLSIGGAAFWAGLSAIDGVDLLYANSQGIGQSGHATDLRLGLTKDWPGDRSFEALVLYDRLRMTHDVMYLDQIWDPATQRFTQQARTEENHDWTDVWGLHLEYERPLNAPGWRIGWVATTNVMSHPKLPNYDIRSVQVIPRDPGTSYAFNLGIGLGRVYGPATFGIDAIFEPIWSHTWADALGPTATGAGDTIPVGGKTVENWFRFNNVLVRMGVNRDLGQTASVQLGLLVHSIRYGMVQNDHVQVTERSLNEHWVEWAPTWGFGLRFPELEIRYQGQVSNGTGRPGVVSSSLRGGVATASLDAANAGSILVAPTGPLSLGEVKVVTHRVGLSIPLR